jgi:predicted small secreted protein
MKRILFIGLLLLMILFAAGCETTKGVGRDMQKAGSWVEDAAK